ncbi:PspA/IM30 family protein [Aliikangiella marina]|uniref:PspA/IM30 family protein n=1 Tax=Aliikangiella marina TaxID=1712262 RepID=A0A545T172_9GAMM|nr:PspA/IM30 family protein [Aliikangiella marina]TQV70964.1 PspA/IM30 family protein [Aliikangiella marina]
MDIINKMLTAIRGGARELGEAVVDAQSIRVFEQEIVDSKENLERAKEGLTELMARKIATERKLTSCGSRIKENEEFALKAIEQGDDSLALEIAAKIAQLEIEKDQTVAELESYSQNVEALKVQIKTAQKVIAEHERELSVVKVKESVQQASHSVTQTVTFDQSSIGSAKETLQQIKDKQQLEQDKIDAGIALRKELEGDDLDTKLKAAGIKQDAHSADQVLARLKAKTQVAS